MYLCRAHRRKEQDITGLPRAWVICCHPANSCPVMGKVWAQIHHVSEIQTIRFLELRVENVNINISGDPGYGYNSAPHIKKIKYPEWHMLEGLFSHFLVKCLDLFSSSTWWQKSTATVKSKVLPHSIIELKTPFLWRDRWGYDRQRFIRGLERSEINTDKKIQKVSITRKTTWVCSPK